MLIKWQGQPVNKDLWPMAAYTVNACYVPSSNEIVFPAGILQAPLYDVNASREENLGGIGYIIAHEITHAFDNNGAKYDKNGNAADWWTAEDYAAFQQLCDEVTAFYDGVEAAPGITCNGALTLSENIADLGAAQRILEAVQRETNPDLKCYVPRHGEHLVLYAPRPKPLRIIRQSTYTHRISCAPTACCKRSTHSTPLSVSPRATVCGLRPRTAWRSGKKNPY